MTNNNTKPTCRDGDNYSLQECEQLLHLKTGIRHIATKKYRQKESTTKNL